MLSCFSNRRYNIKKGTLKIISGPGHSLIYAENGHSEIKIFFHPKEYQINKSAMNDILNGLVFDNNCTGFDVSRLFCGEIWVYFNPVYHSESDKRRVIEKVADRLKKSEFLMTNDGFELF